jgi:hypothetical protein
MSYAYRLMRNGEVCAVEVGFDTQGAAEDAAREAMEGERPAGPYDHAVITRNAQQINTLENSHGRQNKQS